MLRPIKSLLSFLNTNASSLFIANEQAATSSDRMETENHETPEIIVEQPVTIVTTETEPEAIESSKSLPTKKAPHDLNENEVITKENEANVRNEPETGNSKEKNVGEKSNDNEEIGNDKADIVGVKSNEKEESDQTIAKDSSIDVDTSSEVIDVDANDISVEECIVVSDSEQSPQKSHNRFQGEPNKQESQNMLDISLESNEVIILEDTDHNVSFSDPANDPLAVDDEYNVNDITDNVLAPLESSSGQSDLDISAISVYNVDNETDVVVDSPRRLPEKDSLSNGDVNYEATTALQEEAIIEEQEVRSDGSDSGLGLESSALQSGNSSVVLSSPSICKPPPAKGNLKRRSDDLSAVSLIESKRMRKSINFNGVDVYYFPRIQGFGCVPSQGGCTLGMSSRHIDSRSFSLAEHAAEQRRVHKQQMAEINPRGSSSDETESDDEMSEASGSDLDADGSGFLQPVPAKQRRAILRAAGVRKIDQTEKDECRAIRSSREFCGCNCRGYCDPDTCSCSQAGIKCQVDRLNFPCGCTREGCTNVIGRIEFNPARVRTHYIHTIMRLDLENKQKRPHELDGPIIGSSILNYVSSSGVTSSMDCGGIVNTSLSSYSYSNLVSVNNMKNQQIYGTSDAHCLVGAEPQHDRHDVYMNGGSNVYSNRLHGPTLPNTDGSMIKSRLNDTGTGSSSSEPSNNFILGDSHDIDLHYAFRDSSNPSSLEMGQTVPPVVDSTNLLSLSDTLYNDVYSGHSFLSQNYTNTTFCSQDSISYQQNSFLSYTASNATTEPVDITDLTNLPTLDSTTTVTTSAASQVLVPDDSSRYVMPFNMAPSAQTSTSITEGTRTTITQPQVTKPTTLELTGAFESKVENFVDLTEHITPTEEQAARIEVRSESRESDVIATVPKEITIDVDSIEDSDAETIITTVTTETVPATTETVLTATTELTTVTDSLKTAISQLPDVLSSPTSNCIEVPASPSLIKTAVDEIPIAETVALA